MSIILYVSLLVIDLCVYMYMQPHSRSFMITGANSGIGKMAALALAKKGGW